jgi:tRNA threonylcarbamoyladenosine biosynthesis protein TsaE
LTILETRSITWQDEAACARTAQQLASRPAIRRAFVELRGPLGAGKTTFVRHLLHALGVQGRIKSPTYAVMEPYSIEQSGLTSEAWHFDFYRFNDPREWEDAGFREIFASEGLKLAEWPEQADGLLPEPDLRIEIAPSLPHSDNDNDAGAETMRTATFNACSTLGLELLP